MPVIQKLFIKRFRSYPAAEVTFGNPLFIVGRNGSGKSNFADIFAFVADAMKSPLQAVFDSRGGIGAVRNRSTGSGYSPNLGLTLELGPMNGEAKRGRYSLEIKALPNYGFEIIRETAEVELNDGTLSSFDRSSRHGFKTKAEGINPALEPAALCLPVVGGDARFAPLLRTLSGMRVYSIEPARLRDMQDPDSGMGLKRDGSNAASVLQELSRTDRQAFERVQEFLAAIVPDTLSVRPKKHSNKLTMEFTQEWAPGKRLQFESSTMSDGTLRALGLLMAVFQKPTPTVMVIEEPEATIHPGALPAILDMIRQAAVSMQVIVTTHSPELLDAKWIADEHLRVGVWERGASAILPVDAAARSAIRDHIMGAGELLRAGALLPEESSAAGKEASKRSSDK